MHILARPPTGYETRWRKDCPEEPIIFRI